MNTLINYINNSSLFQFKQTLLVNIKYPYQLSFFLKLKNKFINYIIVTKENFNKYNCRKIVIVNINNFTKIVPAFKIFISINPDINNEHFILKIVLQKPFSKKSFFIINRNISNKILNEIKSGFKSRNLFYLKILSKISVLNENLTLISRNNTNKIFKFVTRNTLPIINFFKWDCILKIFYAHKKKKWVNFLIFIIF